MKLDVKIVRFKTDDGVYLNGFLKYNQNASKKVIIAIHGMACSCFSKREAQLSEQAITCGIDSFIFNNRGSEIIKYLEKSKSTTSDDIVGGSSCENIYESCYDIKAAINLMLSMGYEEIYLCGHSLGATKVVYSYYKFVQENEKFLDNIKAVMLLSFVDVNSIFRICAGNTFDEYVKFAIEKKNQNKEMEMMPRECFLYPVSVKTFLIYIQDNEKLDIARYSQNDYDYKELNSIKSPLFMRWGANNELIEQTPDEVIDIIKHKVKNEKLDIGVIENTDHFYRKKEKDLAKEILDFIINVQKG